MNRTGMKVAVIGAGTMGNGIAHVFAQSGHQVSLIDVNAAALTRAQATIERNLDRLVSKERISADDKAATLSRLTTSTEMHGAVADADLVVEAATERLDLKLKIFEQIDASAPASAILATNTSSISITRIAAATGRPDKVIGMHFMNPVPIMKLVEVIRGYDTSDATTATVVALSEQLGKIPVDRQGRPVDIGILPVNGHSEHVDMDIDPVNKEVCPVNMEPCGIQAEWECQRAISNVHM